MGQGGSDTPSSAVSFSVENEAVACTAPALCAGSLAERMGHDGQVRQGGRQAQLRRSPRPLAPDSAQADEVGQRKVK